MAVAAPAWMALSWDIPPQNGHDVYFSRDLYEKYSLAPTLSELMSLSKRNQHSENTAATSHWAPKKKQQVGQETPVKTEPSVAPLQEPRVPYPYVSSLSEKEQRRYLFLLSQYLKADPNLLPWSQQRNYTQYLQMKEFVSKEVAEFLKFTRNAARGCAKDYSDISDDALLYTKGFLSARMSCVKNYPEQYYLHEVTSLMGGQFGRELTLKFEKSLLALGMVHLVKRFFPKLPVSINLPADKAKHEQLCGTPEHRAAQLHNDISTDPNAEQLAAKYCPQVVLTGESLYTLLNNHGLDYKQQWELPVSVKTVSLAGLKPVKVAYINPPLPKKEMTVREKNQLFHEFLADFHMTKQSSVVARAVILDKPSEVQPGAELKSCQGRALQESVSADLDFDTDITELESFASTTKPLRASPAEVSPAMPARLSAGFSEHLDMGKGREGRRSKAKEPDLSSGKTLLDLDSEGNSLGEAFEPIESDPDGRSLALAREENLGRNVSIASLDKNGSINEGTAEDTDGEDLVIDTECEPGLVSEPGVVTSHPSPVGSAPPTPRPGQALSEEPAHKSSGAQEKNAPGKPHPPLSQETDPLGQILKMQMKLLKLPSPNGQGPLPVTSERSLNPTPGQADAPSLPLASSVVEPGPNTVTNTGTSSKFTWATCYQGPQKGMLWDAVEEAADYEPPQQGNLVYKLYSLDGMLLLVRTSIQKVELRPHQKKAKFRRHFPVYVLPKLEYQAFYGVETLTEDEVCRLWMESLLHSNTSFTVGHIDALTSQLFLLERLTGKALKRRFGTFNPTNSLHILQNILKKVAGLQEGSFLLTHLAGDSSASIYKSSDDIATRAMYNLHAAHADLPPAPAALSVPWVPLDPNVPLPHHFAQGRIPCTFPPRPDEGARNAKMRRKTKAFPGTPSCRGPVSTGSRDGSLQAEPPRKKRGAAQDKGSRPANQGPKRKFWKKQRPS
uniref:Interactor of little elongation complex ELL subunit 2 n=1 Tax=Laticauda laticaudata TaxID=8630 RepID=A0A8C5S9Z5_LATLA